MRGRLGLNSSLPYIWNKRSDSAAEEGARPRLLPRQVNGQLPHDADVIEKVIWGVVHIGTVTGIGVESGSGSRIKSQNWNRNEDQNGTEVETECRIGIIIMSMTRTENGIDSTRLSVTDDGPYQVVRPSSGMPI
ncbi:hypothetical protein EVAR_52745_1 [Eumeta japonica]|uniref:Uncharacterized protein n=1 Tax=Eumeta variegata TaxID=151549 RepID=A0A4C1XGC5_EUMVA|nr:hypothetical protein EVAR_52745_1 [Eumeta japonica]